MLSVTTLRLKASFYWNDGFKTLYLNEIKLDGT